MLNSELIQEIRDEQQAQFDAPKSSLQKVLQSISNVFHPMLVMSYVALALCVFSPLSCLPMVIKAYFVGQVFFYTMLLPLLAIALMHVFHVVGHWALRDRRDRVLPLLVNVICYGLNAYVLTHEGFLPNWVLMFFYGAVVLAAIVWIISIWWKISAHAAADASFATVALALGLYFPDQMPLWMELLAILVVGVVSSIRVYLGRHTLAQVGYGALLGVFSVSAGMALWG